MRRRTSACRFADDILKCISLNENYYNMIQISLKFVPYGSSNNKQASVQIMAWCQSVDEPLSEPMMA